MLGFTDGVSEEEQLARALELSTREAAGAQPPQATAGPASEAETETPVAGSPKRKATDEPGVREA
tara:strand:+ start:282 stop:476 length:195 start_codon:yes stop_codon:yes gene_type:complete